MSTGELIREVKESAYHLYLQTDGNRVSKALLKIIVQNIEQLEKESKKDRR